MHPYFFKPVIVLFMLIGISSCKKNDDSVLPQQEITTGSVSIYRNQTLVSEYTDNEVGAMKDEESMHIIIISPDDKYVLSITISNVKKGNFPIDFSYFEPNTAHAHLIWEDAPEMNSNDGLLIFAEGFIEIEELSATQCKGKIEVNGLPNNEGLFYAIKGTFNTSYVEI